MLLLLLLLLLLLFGRGDGQYEALASTRWPDPGPRFERRTGIVRPAATKALLLFLNLALLIDPDDEKRALF